MNFFNFTDLFISHEFVDNFFRLKMIYKISNKFSSIHWNREWDWSRTLNELTASLAIKVFTQHPNIDGREWNTIDARSCFHFRSTQAALVERMIFELRERRLTPDQPHCLHIEFEFHSHGIGFFLPFDFNAVNGNFLHEWNS